MGSENLGPVVSVIFWPGSGSSPSGRTPLGIYDDDDEFVEEAPKIAKWVCFSLGYPVMQVELTDQMIYAQLEQAISEFSSLVNEFNMREYMLNLQGISTGSSITGKLVKSTSLPYVIELSTAYGSEAGSGGDLEYKKGYITMTANEQDYDLQSLWASVSESGNRIEIRRVFHETPAAVTKYYDPYTGGTSTGLGVNNLLGEFGWDNYSVGSVFMLVPMYETALRVQAIEFNDQIRRSQYGFELKDNRLRLFPIPDTTYDGTKLWFEYTVKADKFAGIIGNPITGATGSAALGVVSDYGNAPYTDMEYQYINDVGKRWIRKYTLALCKIVLGNVRNKYASIPIPNAETNLNGDSLISQGQAEMDLLVQQLRETLEQVGRRVQMEKAQFVEQAMSDILKHVPNGIYIW